MLVKNAVFNITVVITELKYYNQYNYYYIQYNNRQLMISRYIGG